MACRRSAVFRRKFRRYFYTLFCHYTCKESRNQFLIAFYFPVPETVKKAPVFSVSAPFPYGNFPSFFPFGFLPSGTEFFHHPVRIHAGTVFIFHIVRKYSISLKSKFLIESNRRSVLGNYLQFCLFISDFFGCLQNRLHHCFPDSQAAVFSASFQINCSQYPFRDNTSYFAFLPYSSPFMPYSLNRNSSFS